MTQPFERIGFIRSSFEAIAYGKLYRYLCRMLMAHQLPVVELLTTQDLYSLHSSTLVVISWDLFTHGGGVPVLPNVKYILLVFEPFRNIEEWVVKRTKSFMMDNIIAYINLVPSLNGWFRNTFPGKPLFMFHQGYVDYEDTRRSESTIDYDVAMPGHCFGDDRPKIVQQLRDQGLNVYDQTAVGLELDNIYQRSKVCAYYPYGSEYTAWHGQRTLWAVNKGVCCVGVQSEDKQSEQLYKDLYVACTRDTFVGTVKHMVQSGDWKTYGEQAYQRYRTQFNAIKMFGRTFISYLRSILLHDMPKQVISMFKVRMHPEAIELATQVLQSGHLTQGPKVDEFEQALGNFFQRPAKLLTTVNSATTGLTLALRLLQEPNSYVKWPGFDSDKDHVLTSPLTCTATNWAVLANNYKIQWVDVCRHSPNISLDDLESKWNEHSKIILFVHWAGVPVELHELFPRIDRFEQKYGFRPMIIEDCAHALGSELYNVKIGAHGNICVFSFQAIKQLTTSDGGLVIWPNEQLANRARMIRWFGIDRNAPITGPDFRDRESTDIKEFGFKWHMNDLNAAIGIGNLRHIQDVIYKHSTNCDALRAHINEIDPTHEILQNMYTTPIMKVCGWVFTLLVPNANARVRFLQFMTDQKIQSTQVHFRNDRHSCTFANTVQSTSLPTLDILSQRYVCIPSGWWLSAEDLEHIKWALDIFVGREKQLLM